MKRHFCIFAEAGIWLSAASIVLSGCGPGKESKTALVSETSLFSWEEEYILPEMEEEVEKVMERLGCNVVYQQIPSDAQEAEVLDYLKRRGDKGQLVYYLAGASEWGLQENAVSMLEAVKNTAEWNRKAGEGKGFTGIVWDVEPYLLDEWEDNREEYMQQYVENCIHAYEEAQQEQLAVIVCIPNFYDRTGLTEQLELLVQKGCDGIAVMNYDKRDEAGQIAGEMELTEKYKKGIIHITEMQKPGYHSLTEQNTYYYDGFDAVLESWERLRQEYPYEYLGFSWHYLKPCLHLMEKEENA